MTTQVYHVTLNAEEHTALIALHHIGTTIARAIKHGNATPAQRENLYRKWLTYLSKIEPALYKQTTEINHH